MNIIRFVENINAGAYERVYPDITQICREVEGFSKPNLMQVLSLAVAQLEEDEIYLEIGAYRGRTLCGALVANRRAQAVAVDNFSEFTTDIADASATLIANIGRYGLEKRVTFYQEDTREFLAGHQELWGKVGVYFYDGNHNTDQGLAALQNALPFLAPRALIIMDDISGRGVWRSLAEFQYLHAYNTMPVFLMATPGWPNGTSHQWHNGIVALAWNKLVQGDTIIS